MSNANRYRKRRTNRVAGAGGGVVDTARGGSLARGGRRTNTEFARILWFSNAPWAATGYGQQTAQVVPRLKKAGHEVAVHAMFGLEGAASSWQGVKVYPRGASAYSDDVVVAHMLDHANGNLGLTPLLVTLFDAWVFKSKTFDQLTNIVSWVPVDHSPCPPDVLAWCARKNVMPIAMSKFGSRMFDLAGIKHLYVPHGVEKVFEPTPFLSDGKGGQVSGRQLMGVQDDRFVVSIVAANKGVSPCRKAFGENLLAFGVFAQNHRDAVLYVHSESRGAMGGVDLLPLIEACGIPSSQVVVVDQYAYRGGFPVPALAAMYTASDVLLATSLGEGFGIPTVEAQACGTRVIVSDVAASTELVGNGWLVETQPLWDPAQQAWWGVPRVGAIVDALKQAYEAPRGVDEASVVFAAQYGADAVWEAQWVPAMAEIMRWANK